MSDAARLLDALARRGERVATAESLTGGLLAAEIVAVPGASNAFSGGVVAYSTELKHSIVGVDADLLAERGAVDADVACQLADRVRLVCAVDGRPADVGIATTGVAGPDPQDGHAPGTVFVGIASARGIRSVRLELGGDRDSIRRATVAAALALALEDFDSDAE
ncbi:CinA family protein [Agromyces atrinae]|uniref:CinA family protein n=1 Tax=Agromyces atrinae TaxID=592376 RepID=A0A4V1R2H2_9MICO|nr:CinA family protein [Agromyces atrinae]NYD66467.1 nicotinamide-nucleotide amidase [Agromyces atrinae]RXZ87146.1 CinA family protein [Agromyces atrinae]